MHWNKLDMSMIDTHSFDDEPDPLAAKLLLKLRCNAFRLLH